MDKQALIKALKTHPEILSAILFGSQASERADQKSDIDIALLYEATQIPKDLDLLRFKDELSDVMHQDVDIVLLNVVSPIIAMQAIKNGIPLFIRDQKMQNMYEV